MNEMLIKVSIKQIHQFEIIPLNLVTDKKKNPSDRLTSSEVTGFPAEGEVLYLAVPRVYSLLRLDLMFRVRGPGAVQVLAVLRTRAVLKHILFSDRCRPLLGILV